MIRILRRHSVWILFGLALLGITTSCEQVFVEPAPPASSLALALTAMGGQAQAFDKADSIYVQLRDAAGVRVETTLPIQQRGSDIPLAIDVPLSRSQETLSLLVELHLGRSVLFRGTGTVQLRAGPVPARVDLEPVGHALLLPDAPTTLTAFGDTLRVNGAVVFATLDTVTVTPISDWTSLNPAVVAVLGNVPVARSDGVAQLIGRAGALADTMTVQVIAEVAAIALQPADPLMPLGTSRQYSARLTDRRGNPLVKPVMWTSTNPFVIAIDSAGLATARGAGSALIRASSGTALASLSVQVRLLPPLVTTTPPAQIAPASVILTADIHPNGQDTDVWFVFGPDSTFVEADISQTISVPAGSAVVPVSITVSVAPAAQYYAHAYARSAGGTTAGNIISFVTPSPTFGVQTMPATGVTFTGATLNGLVYTDTASATAWFEWGTDSALAVFSATPTISVPPNMAPYYLFVDLDSLSYGQAYYYRVAARSGSGIARGTIASFTPGFSSLPTQAALPERKPIYRATIITPAPTDERAATAPPGPASLLNLRPSF